MSTMEERAAEVAETLITVAFSVRPPGNDNIASTAFGFGIDSNSSEAAAKAVRDALDRTLAYKSQYCLGYPSNDKAMWILPSWLRWSLPNFVPKPPSRMVDSMSPTHPKQW
jgi:hypothetical protein